MCKKIISILVISILLVSCISCTYANLEENAVYLNDPDYGLCKEIESTYIGSFKLKESGALPNRSLSYTINNKKALNEFIGHEEMNLSSIINIKEFDFDKQSIIISYNFKIKGVYLTNIRFNEDDIFYKYPEVLDKATMCITTVEEETFERDSCLIYIVDYPYLISSADYEITYT